MTGQQLPGLQSLIVVSGDTSSPETTLRLTGDVCVIWYVLSASRALVMRHGTPTEVQLLGRGRMEPSVPSLLLSTPPVSLAARESNQLYDPVPLHYGRRYH